MTTIAAGQRSATLSGFCSPPTSGGSLTALILRHLRPLRSNGSRICPQPSLEGSARRAPAKALPPAPRRPPLARGTMLPWPPSPGPAPRGARRARAGVVCPARARGRHPRPWACPAADGPLDGARQGQAPRAAPSCSPVMHPNSRLQRRRPGPEGPGSARRCATDASGHVQLDVFEVAGPVVDAEAWRRDPAEAGRMARLASRQATKVSPKQRDGGDAAELTRISVPTAPLEGRTRGRRAAPPSLARGTSSNLRNFRRFSGRGRKFPRGREAKLL